MLPLEFLHRRKPLQYFGPKEALHEVTVSGVCFKIVMWALRSRAQVKAGSPGREQGWETAAGEPCEPSDDTP